MQKTGTISKILTSWQSFLVFQTSMVSRLCADQRRYKGAIYMRPWITCLATLILFCPIGTLWGLEQLLSKAIVNCPTSYVKFIFLIYSNYAPTCAPYRQIIFHFNQTSYSAPNELRSSTSSCPSLFFLHRLHLPCLLISPNSGFPWRSNSSPHFYESYSDLPVNNGITLSNSL